MNGFRRRGGVVVDRACVELVSGYFFFFRFVWLVGGHFVRRFEVAFFVAFKSLYAVLLGVIFARRNVGRWFKEAAGL